MKKQLTFKCLFPLMWLLIPTLSYAQEGTPPPCSEVREVKIATDTTKRRILYEFVKSCVQNGFFSRQYDKGIIVLYEYRNEQDQACWLLKPTLDNSYQDNPPTRFADFEGDIVLIYDADSKRNPVKTTQDKAALNQCLEQIIGDRVFNRPSTKKRWTSELVPYTNKKRSEGNRRAMTGNGGSAIFIFNKDGSYKRTTPV